MQAAAEGPAIIVFGNCQAAPLAQVLRAVPSVASRFVVHTVSSFDMQQNNPARFLDAVDMSRVAAVLAQREAGLPLPDWLTARLERHTALVQFPVLEMRLLWPFSARDPRNRPEPGHRFGRYPYGDRLVVDLLKTGISGAALFDAYMERSAALLRAELGEMRRCERERLLACDAGCAVTMADVVLAEVARRRLFNSFNHPDGWLFRRLASRVLEAVQRLLGLGGDGSEVETHMRGFDPLAAEQVPIHPVVARMLRLAWWKPGQLYMQPDGTTLNFRQYMRRYIEFV